MNIFTQVIFSNDKDNQLILFRFFFKILTSSKTQSFENIETIQQVCDGVVYEINFGCGSTTPTPPNLKYSSETKIRIRKISEWVPSFKPQYEVPLILVANF